MLYIRELALRAVGLAGLGLVFIACGGDDDDGGEGTTGGSVSQLCAQVCQKAAGLNCPNDTNCASTCESEAAAFQGCESESQALLDCAAARPASDFECGTDGESTTKDGVCSTEGNALATCVLANLGGGGSGGTGGTGGAGGASGGSGGSGGPDSCAFANDGECDEPDFCDPGTDTTDCGG